MKKNLKYYFIIFLIFIGISCGPEYKNRVISAAIRGDTTALKVLIDKGAKVNEPDNDGLTALHWAINFCKEEAAIYLIKNGANVDEKDEYGQTPLMHLADTQCIMPDVGKELIEAGADINTVNKAGLTALMISAINGDYGLGSILVKQKSIGINKQDFSGMTALHYAAMCCNKDFIELLITNGASSVISDSSDLLPFSYALNNCCKRKILNDLLISSDDSIISDTMKLNNLLLSSAESGCIEAAKILLHYGADINYKTNNGETLLTISTYERDMGFVSFLLKEITIKEFRKQGGLKVMERSKQTNNNTMENMLKDFIYMNNQKQQEK